MLQLLLGLMWFGLTAAPEELPAPPTPGVSEPSDADFSAGMRKFELADYDGALAVWTELYERPGLSEGMKARLLLAMASALEWRYDQDHELGDLKRARVLYDRCMQMEACTDGVPGALQERVSSLDQRIEAATAAPPQPPATPDDRPPPVTPPADPGEDEFKREGFFVSVGAGVASCAQPQCFEFPIAGSGRAELGYRIRKIVAPFASVSVSGAKLELSATEGSFVALDAGVGAHLFPIRTGRIDPYWGAMLGYSRVVSTYQDDAFANTWQSRGTARLTHGVNIYLMPRFMIGPRFDLNLPFAGKICTSAVGTDTQCDEIIPFINDLDTEEEKRLVRRSLAKPWSVTLQLTGIF